MSVSDYVEVGNAAPQRNALRTATDRSVVLIIVDDESLAKDMRAELEASGFEVHVARSRAEGLQAYRSEGASAIIVDRMDGKEGLGVVEALRASSDTTPVLAVGAPSSVDERIAYIRSGADDYLTRPFDLREMTARVEALLRRCREDRQTMLEVGAIEMDLVRREVRCGGRRVELLPREFTLLEYFARNPRQVLSRRKLLEDVWRYKSYVRTNVVDVQVGNVRRKLDPTGERRYIVSVRGAGFRLEPEGLN